MPTETDCKDKSDPKHTVNNNGTIEANFEDSQGSTFSFDGVKYGATSVNLQVDGYDAGDQTVDISTLSLLSGCCRVKVDPPLYDCGDTTSDGTLTLNFYTTAGNANSTWGVQTPDMDDSATLIFPKFDINQTARCTSLSLDASVGEFVTGSATFELSKTSD